MRFLALCFGTVVPVLVAVGMLQPASLSQEAPVSPTLTEKDKSQRKVERKDSKAFTGTTAEGVARAFQYRYEYAEQPNRVLVQGPGNTTQLVPNPEHNLNQHSLTFDLSQVFPTSADIAAARKAGNTVKTPWWERALSGTLLKGSLSEHPRITQSTLLPDTFAKHGFGGEVDFDPTKGVFGSAKVPSGRLSDRSHP
ncbi:MAG: hypothetical protein LAO06_13465 [Acidobacteriia bacterium]|nr:hypothetical protein [Terriglobia bacterium]